jgi:hypothetical protein
LASRVIALARRLAAGASTGSICSVVKSFNNVVAEHNWFSNVLSSKNLHR